MSVKRSSGHVVTIKYTTPTHFQGRNGYFKCTGLEIVTHDCVSDIAIFPITSKGRSGNCCIEIPKDKINEVIETLKGLK